MNHPARVLLLAKGLGRGGTERLLVDAVACFDPNRVVAEVAYVLPWKDALVPELTARDVAVHCLGSGRGGLPAWPLRLARLVRGGGFDIVHSHMPLPGVVARLCALGRGPALVHTEHNVWPRYRPATYWANALTYHCNAAVLAVSEGVAESIQPPRLLRRWPTPPAEVMVHGINPATVRRGPEARAEGRRRLGLGPDSVVMGTVGNLSAKKDHSSLLKATALLTPRFPGLQLVVVGAGPLERVLREEAVSLNLGKHVLWTGSRDDVPSLLPAFDVFVLSSQHEGLSIALIEAMAAGLPCVATRVGGIPEVIEDGVDGILVPHGQPSALAAAVIRVLTDDTLRASLTAAAPESAEQFHLDSAIERLQEVYLSVLAAS